MINNVFYKPQEEEIQELSNVGNKGAKEWVPLFLANNKETPCP
jgi:hypothetical protein